MGAVLILMRPVLGSAVDNDHVGKYHLASLEDIELSICLDAF